jgi:sugar/nucleoside kinase (ribokinase family)
MIGRVGEDEFAEGLKTGLEDDLVDVSEVKQAAGKTSGVALILVSNNIHF